MNSDLSPEFVERYQILYQQDPKSKVFAPLAEAYRRLGMLKEAEQTCRAGVKIHPQFPSGRVVMAKICMDKGLIKEATDHLRVATDLSPDNILAQRLLAQALMEQKMPKEALKAFKMILFLNPADLQAQKTVQKLESLTADEYDDELFEMKPLKNAMKIMRTHQDVLPSSQIELETPSRESRSIQALQRTLERALSLADAFVVRNDFDKALATLEQAEEQIGVHPEITKRRRFLTQRNSGHEVKQEEATAIRPVLQDLREENTRKISSLKSMLQRVNDRRIE